MEKVEFVTGNFENLIVGNTDNNIPTRNAVSTVTKRKPYPRRKILQIKPLPIKDIVKELEESENEAQPDIEQSNKENEPKTAPLLFENLQKEVDAETQPHNEQSNKENEPKNDSFEMSFATLALTTPAKWKEVIKDGDFATPQFKSRLQPTLPQKTNRSLVYQFTTPSNKIAPKIQCSVNMQTYLKTPIEKVCMATEKSKPGCDENTQLEPPIPPLKTIIVNNVEYLILNELGKGGSSEVFHCFNHKTKEHRAVKCVSLQNPQSASGFIKEVQMLRTLQKCNRIIKMFDYEINQDTKSLLVVLEVGGADLSKILKESALNTAHMPVYMLIYYWMEMLYAVQQIHSNGIIHTDLKPANFLQIEGHLKLIDFGIASCIQNDMTSVIKPVPEGSLNYISPEAVNNQGSSNEQSPSYGAPKYKVSFKSDVWSLGCILYQLVYRRTPFQHIGQLWAKMSILLDPNHKIAYPDANWVPPKIINTIKKCLQHNMKLRPSVNELVSEYENIFQDLSIPIMYR